MSGSGPRALCSRFCISGPPHQNPDQNPPSSFSTIPIHFSASALTLADSLSGLTGCVQPLCGDDDVGGCLHSCALMVVCAYVCVCLCARAGLYMRVCVCRCVCVCVCVRRTPRCMSASNTHDRKCQPQKIFWDTCRLVGWCLWFIGVWSSLPPSCSPACQVRDLYPGYNCIIPR